MAGCTQPVPDGLESGRKRGAMGLAALARGDRERNGRAAAKMPRVTRVMIFYPTLNQGSM